MRVVVAGDFCDRYRVSNLIKTEDYAALFSEVYDVIHNADYSIVNFEFPIVSENGKPIPKCGPNLAGHKNSVFAIKYAGFNVCTLANNHILDQGANCCIETIRSLRAAGINTVGAGNNLAEAGDILYLQANNEKLAIINCCEHEFSIAEKNSPGANPLNPIQQFYKIQEAKQFADYILLIIHGGHEHFQLPSPRMKELYHFFIDVGADVVINHHQHCYSGYEVYKDKPIFYGLGNFLFDHISLRNDIWNEGYLVDLVFNKHGISYKIIPYRQCTDEPTVQFLYGSDLTHFEHNIQKLNYVIRDESELENQVNEYYKRCSEYLLSILRPYRNRISKKLYRMGLLPELINEEKSLQIRNHISCESHLEKMLYALSHKK